jgi:hypothetical protein
MMSSLHHHERMRINRVSPLLTDQAHNDRLAQSYRMRTLVRTSHAIIAPSYNNTRPLAHTQGQSHRARPHAGSFKACEQVMHNKSRTTRNLLEVSASKKGSFRSKFNNSYF